MELHWENKALRSAAKFPKDVRKKVAKAVQSLKSWPNARGWKKLTNRDEYRLRIGRHRVIFKVTGQEIWITEVRRRKEDTYR